MARSARRTLPLLLAALALALVASSALAQSSSSSPSSSSSSSSVFRPSPPASSASSAGADASAARRSDTAMGVFAGLDRAGGISAGPSVLAAAGILLGGVTTIAGFRLFRPVVFLGALAAGGYLVAHVVERAVREDSDYVVLCSWLAFGLGGVLAGAAAAGVEALGKLTVGACAGVLLACLLNVGVGHKIDADEPDRLLLVLQVALGLVAALGALDSIALILSLSFAGAFVLLYGAGYFAGSLPVRSDLAAYREANRTEAWLSAVPVAWWIYLAVFLAVFATGLYVQLAKAREHGYYDDNGKFVYAAHSDDEVESSGRANRRGAGAIEGEDSDERKSPSRANFQNFAPYQPPTYAAGHAQGSTTYSSSAFGDFPSANASSYGNNPSHLPSHNPSSRSSGSRQPASTYVQPYTSYYTRPPTSTASMQPSQQARGYQSYGQQRYSPTSPM